MLKLRIARNLLKCHQSSVFVASLRLPATPPRRCSQSPKITTPVFSRGYRTALYCFMCRREAETSPSARVHKKRRVSYSTTTMSQTTETNTPRLPSVQLTPIESTLKELLLDIAKYIREQTIAKGGSEGTPQTELRFTGGWVRDKLLGVDSHDIDVGISNMTGYQYGMALKEYLDIPENLDKYKKNHPDSKINEAIASLHKIDANPEKSKHLETATTKIFGLDIDLVNLRKETYLEDSRNPQMEFGTAQEDAMRRDATINALFYNLNESKVEDLTGLGFTDMQNKIIRTPLEPFQTFKDDPLRVLRLVRFASRLGYRIHEDTEGAMHNDEISEALKLKISRERVGTELDKMLQGPDPKGSLEIIDRTGLYPTIFTNLQDDAQADTSSWSLAYDAFEKLLHPTIESDEGIKSVIERVRALLIRNKLETYYAWIVTAFAPWASVPVRITKGSKAKPNPPRAAEVARDSLRSDNRTISLLRETSNNWSSIIDVKSTYLKGDIDGTPAEIRQQIGLHLRSWNRDWRLCFIAAILQEVQQGREFPTGKFFKRHFKEGTYWLTCSLAVIQEYDSFLAYISEHDLIEICEIKPIVDGGEIMRALKAKGGPWTGKAMETVIKWQLLHPEITEKEKALAEVSSRREEFGLPPAS